MGPRVNDAVPKARMRILMAPRTPYAIAEAVYQSRSEYRDTRLESRASQPAICPYKLYSLVLCAARLCRPLRARRRMASGGSKSQLRPENYHHDPGQRTAFFTLQCLRMRASAWFQTRHVPEQASDYCVGPCARWRQAKTKGKRRPPASFHV